MSVGFRPASRMAFSEASSWNDRAVRSVPRRYLVSPTPVTAPASCSDDGVPIAGVPFLVPRAVVLQAVVPRAVVPRAVVLRAVVLRDRRLASVHPVDKHVHQTKHVALPAWLVVGVAQADDGPQDV